MTEENNMIVCWFCGEDIEEGLKVCPICKNSLEDEREEKQERRQIKKREKNLVLPQEKKQEISQEKNIKIMTPLTNEVKVDALTNHDQLTNLRIVQKYTHLSEHLPKLPIFYFYIRVYHAITF